MATMDASADIYEKLRTLGDHPVTKDPPKFDLDAYIAHYEGKSRLQRLTTIGLSSAYLSLEALRAAITEAKRGKNVDAYMNLVETLQKLSPDDPLAASDSEWVDSKVKQVRAEGDRLEHELKGYRNNLIKESIRMGNEDLGAFYYDIGDLPAAYRAYARMRDYCTSPKHVADMNLKLVLVGIANRDWISVQTSLLKVQSLALKPEDKAKVDAIIPVTLGLTHLANGQYRDAAEEFLRARPSFINLEPIANIPWNRAVLTPNDVAVYGGLCALASMDRNELQRRVLENNDFRNFLELEPHIRRAVSFFCSSKYSQCLETLEAYRTDYILDLYLQSHVKELYQHVRSKSMVQYFIPFSCVTLDAMASAFGNGEKGIEEELRDMIQNGVLNARIDLVDRLLLAHTPNPRTKLQDDALKMAREYEKTLQLRLSRINLIQAGLEVKGPKTQQSQPAQSYGNGTLHLTGGGAISRGGYIERV